MESRYLIRYRESSPDYEEPKGGGGVLLLWQQQWYELVETILMADPPFS